MRTPKLADWLICQWFARCENPATTVLPHPVLGDVPTCERCAEKVARINAASRPVRWYGPGASDEDAANHAATHQGHKR